MIDGIATSIIGSYLYATLRRISPQALKSVAPAAFRANPKILNNIEKPLRLAKANVLEKYRDYSTISTLLNERNVSEMLLLQPIFDHIFLGKTLDVKHFRKSIKSCVGPGEEIIDGKLVSQNRRYRGATSDGVKFRGEKSNKPSFGISIDEILDDIVYEIKSSITAEGSNHKEATLQLSISEIQHAVHTMELVSRTTLAKVQCIDTSHNDKFHSLLKEYHSYLKKNSEVIVIHGLKSAAGENQQVQHMLENAYVPLTMNPLEELIETDAEDKPSPPDWRGNAITILEKSQYTVLRGHAGCGKTTLMQWYIANSGPFSKSDQKLNVPVTPIYVPLRRLEAAQKYDWSLTDLMRFSVPNETLRNAFDYDWMKTATSLGYNLAFLLDGVDEISEENREKFWKLTREIQTTLPTARIVVTSRHLSDVHLASGLYRDVSTMSKNELLSKNLQWDLPIGFLEFVMSPFTDDEISSFIEKWHAAIDKKALSEEEIAKLEDSASNLDFILSLEENSEAKELCRTPLLCGLLCLVYFIQDAKLPASRRQLYEISTKILLKLRDEYRDVDEGLYRNIDLNNRLGLLRHIALAMQEGADTDSGSQTIEVDKSVVLSWVENWLEKNAVQDIDAAFLLRKLVERSSIIREPTVDKIDFVHRSFMEYLSANEIVLKREAHTIRKYIEFDQWWSTLQFCMDTQTGGNLFAGDLIETLINYICKEKNGNRNLLLRTAMLLSSANEIPQKYLPSLSLSFEKLAPPRNWDEVDALTAYPFECFQDALDYKTVIASSNPDYKVYCAALLSKHADLRTMSILLEGYQRDEDHEVIRWINHSLKVPVPLQSALIARLKNNSYNNTVRLRIADFSEAVVNNLRFRKLFISCRGKPTTGGSFSCMSLVSTLYIDSAEEAHWRVLLTELKRDHTKHVRFLELIDCSEVNCDLLQSLFPNLKRLVIRRCQKLSLKGLSKLSSLTDLDIQRSGYKFSVKLEHLPKSLRNLRVSKQVDLDPDIITMAGLNCEKLT